MLIQKQKPFFFLLDINTFENTVNYVLFCHQFSGLCPARRTTYYNKCLWFLLIYLIITTVVGSDKIQFWFSYKIHYVDVPIERTVLQYSLIFYHIAHIKVNKILFIGIPLNVVLKMLKTTLTEALYTYPPRGVK